MRPFLGQKRQQYCSFYYEIAVPDLGRIVKKVGQRRNSFSGTLVVKHCSKHLSPTYKCGEYSTQLQTFGQKFCFVAFSRGYSVDQINVTELGDHARKQKTINKLGLFTLSSVGLYRYPSALAHNVCPYEELIFDLFTKRQFLQ